MNEQDIILKEKRLLKLRNIIKNHKNKHINFFSIFKKNNIDYCENNNGIFINLSVCDDKTIQELEDYIDYIKVQESDINQRNKQQENVKNICF